MSASRLTRRLRRLWEDNPRCFWCDTITVWYANGKGRSPKDSATIDHLRSRYNESRQEPNPLAHARTVLACWKCNNVRNKEEQARVPIEELWRRARNGH